MSRPAYTALIHAVRAAAVDPEVWIDLSQKLIVAREELIEEGRTEARQIMRKALGL